MAQPPVRPSPFHKVIKAVAAVRTKGGLAALTLVLLFLCFVFNLFLMDITYKPLISVIILGLLVGFAVFSLIILRKEE